MIDQITVFLENTSGRLASLCRTMGDAGINMHALALADTTDYGVARIICDDPAKARQVLDDNDYRATVTKVAAIAIPDRPGGLADVLECLQRINVNVEYGYCFATEGTAVFVCKIAGGDKALVALSAAGFHALQPVDLYTPDAI